MNYKLLDFSNKSDWINLINKLPVSQQDIYFTPEYYQLYEKLNDGKACCFVFEDDDKIVLYPFLINSVNKLGYDLNDEYFDIQGAYGYNGILINTNDKNFVSQFYSTFSKFCKEHKVIAEFSRFHPLLNNQKYADDYMDVFKDRNTVFLNLDQSHEDIWTNQYSSNNRNMIRKAIKKGFQVEIYENPTDQKIKSFIEIYQNTMKAIDAETYYFFNENYFINTFKNFKSNAALIEVINKEGQVECAAIVLVYGIYSHYHLSGRISNSDNSVNNLILDEAIKYSIQKGAKYFHLGGGISSNTDDPLLKFKSNFSKEKGDFYIGKKIHNKEIYDQVITQWSTKYPDKTDKYSKVLLKYRY